MDPLTADAEALAFPRTVILGRKGVLEVVYCALSATQADDGVEVKGLIEAWCQLSVQAGVLCVNIEHSIKASQTREIRVVCGA